MLVTIFTMEITKDQLIQLREFFTDNFIEDDWLLLHADIKFEDVSKSVIITIDNVNEQEYNWFKPKP